MPPPVLVTFSAGSSGPWRIERLDRVAGEGLPSAERLAISEGTARTPSSRALWALSGTTSNLRYSHRGEAQSLLAVQEGLGRPEARFAALIPIRKTESWWALAQDERRLIFEETSRHIRIGLDYLPEVARRLHHGRDLGEPFDFLTWFEYGPEHATRFEEMVRRLRDTEEWRYVEREVDLRLVRA